MELIKENLETPEVKEAKILTKKLEDVGKKKFFTKEQFYDVAMWKSPRPKRHYLKNSDKDIINVSKLALNSDSENQKVTLLTSLNGVSIAVASALLTIINPKDYGIIDIRVWQLLHLYNEVKQSPKDKDLI